MRIVGKVLVGVLLMVACTNPRAGRTSGHEGTSEEPLEYAKGFQVRTLENGVKLVDVADPQTDEDKMPVSYHFALVPREKTTDNGQRTAFKSPKVTRRSRCLWSVPS